MALEQTGESSHKGAPLSQRAKNMARALVSPSMIASYLAVVLTLLHVTDEGIIGQTCNMLGAATAPCAMLIVGSSLGKMRVKDMITDGWAWVTAFLRLIAVPVITFALFSLVIPDQHQLIAILTILAAMPAAAHGPMLALAYGGDTMTMARVTFLSTLFSLLTLPVVAMLVV
jgi:predicted permease